MSDAGTCEWKIQESLHKIMVMGMQATHVRLHRQYDTRRNTLHIASVYCAGSVSG